MSVARLLERGKTEIGCVSTGNVGTAVASLAAKAGVDAYVFYPNRLEDMKARACMALGAKVCQVEGNYDEANRRCREVAEATRHGLREHHAAPVLRRGREDGGVRDRRAARLAGARPHRQPGGRRHAVLAHAQGPERAAAAGARRDRAARDPHRPAERLQPDRLGDPRRGGGGASGDARDGGALARDRRARRRLPGDRRGAQTWRHGGVRLATRRSSRASTCWPRPRAC